MINGDSYETAGINKIKEKFDGNGIVLMIIYENSQLKEIKDVFIGDEVNINDKNSIEYIMSVYLATAHHKRAIESIIDKIDLDIDADFRFGISKY